MCPGDFKVIGDAVAIGVCVVWVASMELLSKVGQTILVSIQQGFVAISGYTPLCSVESMFYLPFVQKPVLVSIG